jgi:hypothetical protein
VIRRLLLAAALGATLVGVGSAAATAAVNTTSSRIACVGAEAPVDQTVCVSANQLPMPKVPNLPTRP